ncbi:TetR/AcrR family transcriptional regulator [Thermasporomyces composti]|jgi:AcrR family transcriptional regulator|uniref:TetR family transcriptional regulator n=1 Tax=Thermasporomyces composti TaxID=696763 RepID=A0A3D9V4Y6_THECX|nr:TetR/AcrR family transcriptional regulator C-terminal domain-containing protein [Thermasporomyces composti]REF35763.1 TetR family transcriptional regulator [Thermasporomyces composti]
MTVRRTAGRRPKGESLTRDAVVRAAIEILDESGERGLTFRALADHLRTGPGAIYWHVANREELLDLACDAVLSESEPVEVPVDGDELDAIRALALPLFDTLDAHPWIGAHLPRSSGVPSALRTLDRIGTLLASFGVPADRQFLVATAIFTYVLGTAAQMTRNALAAVPSHTRDDWLTELSARYQAADPHAYPFLRRIATEIRTHDDREQFVTGLDLLLAGIRAEVRSGT